MLIETHLTNIQTYLDLAAERLTALRAQMERLEQEGMYPAIPSEQWQSRNGIEEKRYLYMLFRKGSNGRYQGPDGKRKVYVGCNPERIAEARRLAANRREYENLNKTVERLEMWINARQREVGNLADRCKSWARPASWSNRREGCRTGVCGL